jgi:phosphate uptake regulator
MIRKVIRQGHNTLTVTIPSSWSKKFNLQGGSELELTERDNGLFISTQKNGESRRAEFDITGMDIPIIWKYFMAVYREGYDEVLVKFPQGLKLESPYKFLTLHKLDLRYGKEREKVTIFAALQGFVTRFIGYEIIEHGKDYVLVREMGELTSKQFDNSLRKIFLILQEMAEDTLESIENNDPSVLSQVHDVDVNLDKFHDYCVRILNKTANKEQRKSELLFSTLYLLELIGDEFKNISQHMVYDTPKSKLRDIGPLAKSVKDQLDAYYDLFYNFDKNKISRISEIDSNAYIKMPVAYKRATEIEKEIYHHLRMISRYINALLELRIEMEF